MPLERTGDRGLLGPDIVESSLSARFLAMTARAPNAAPLQSMADGEIVRHDNATLRANALSMAAWLRGRGVGPGVMVGLCMENSVNWPLAYFGGLLAGATMVPMDVVSTPDDVDWYQESAGFRLVFASKPETFARLMEQGRVDGLILPPNVTSTGQKQTGFAEVLETPPLPEAEASRQAGSELASIIFTSGTTGRPKGVMLTHANFLANLSSIRRLGAIGADDNFLSVLPLHHAYPFMVNLLVPLLLGCTATYLPTLKPELLLAALKDARVTILMLTPQYIGLFHKRILKRFEDLPAGLGRLIVGALRAAFTLERRTGFNPLGFLQNKIRQGVGPAFRFFISGGAKLDEAALTDLLALGPGAFEGYGLSETSPVLTINPPWDYRIGSVGRALPGVEVRIDNPQPDESGIVIGEVLARGANLMPGYLGNPQATAEAIRDGWFHTGDLGRLDADGFLFLHGRIKEVIVLASGKKVSAEEAERHYASAKTVKELAILAEPGKDTLSALVVPNQDYLREHDAADMRGAVRWELENLSASLPPYRRITSFVLTSGELPRTRLGKLKRHVVAKLYAERKAERAPDGPDGLAAPEPLTDSEKRVLAVVAKVSGKPGARMSDHLELDLGMDSLTRVELLTELEDLLNATIEESDFMGLATVADVVRLAESLASGLGDARRSAPHGRSAARSWADILAAPLDEQSAGRVHLESRSWEAPIQSAGHLLLRGVCRLVFGLRVEGAENLPDGPCLVIPNHVSYLDGFFVATAAPKPFFDRLFFIGVGRYLQAPVVRSLNRLGRLVSITASRNLVETLRISAHVLKFGKALCVFPEGARSPDGALREFKKGPAILARELNVPVVPVFLAGAEKVWNPSQRFPRPGAVTVRFGQPLTPEQLYELGRAANPALTDPHALIAAGMREAVRRLSGEA